MSTPISPPPVTSGGSDDLPAYVSNGLIGLRILDIPLLPGVTLVNGYSGLHPVVQVEAAAEAPYPLAGDLEIDGIWLTTAPHQAEFLDQGYDFATGELTTRFRFHASDASATVEITTLCSRQHPTLVLQEAVVRVDRSCHLTIRARIDTSVPGRMLARHLAFPGEDERAVDGSIRWSSLGDRSTVGIAYITEYEGPGDVERIVQDWGVGEPIATDHRVQARPDRSYRIRQITSLVPSILHEAPDEQAVRLAAHAADRGFDRIREENRAAWREIWDGRIRIDAEDDRWQALADAAFYYLNASVHPSAPSSTSIYGLAQWLDYHYYYGHVMWDVDVFCVPPVLLSQPDAARSLLGFRLRSMDAAQALAKLHGRQGIQFPWEAGPRRGDESTPGAGRGAWYEDHVTVDVAWAVALADRLLGDRRFLADDASRLLYGVADWLVSRVARTADGFVIRETMGVAERSRPADGDAYTTMAAQLALDAAIETASTLGHMPDPRWDQVRRGLRIEPSASNGAVMSYDGFHPNDDHGGTPAPAAGVFPLGYRLAPDVERSTLEYFLALRDRYIGSPMLSPFYGVWAAWIGDRTLATRTLEDGYAALIGDRFVQTLELAPATNPQKPRSGPFFANLGGFLTGLTYGFPGLRVTTGDPSTWPARPVVLPEGWRSIQAERVWIRQVPMTIEAAHGADRATVRPLETGNARTRAA